MKVHVKSNGFKGIKMKVSIIIDLNLVKKIKRVPTANVVVF